AGKGGGSHHGFAEKKPRDDSGSSAVPELSQEIKEAFFSRGRAGCVSAVAASTCWNLRPSLWRASRREAPPRHKRCPRSCGPHLGIRCSALHRPAPSSRRSYGATR